MDSTLKAVLISLFVGTVLAGLGFYLGGLRVKKERKTDKVLNDEKVAIEAVKTRDLRISELERHVTELQQRADAQSKAAIPIEAAMQAMLIAKLTNSHLPQADALLKKATDGTLTPDDAVEFADALTERETDTDPRIGEAQQLAAKILPDMIRLRELAEIEQQSGCETKTVMVTVPETKTVEAQDGGTQEEEKGN